MLWSRPPAGQSAPKSAEAYRAQKRVRPASDRPVFSARPAALRELEIPGFDFRGLGREMHCFCSLKIFQKIFVKYRRFCSIYLLEWGPEIETAFDWEGERYEREG